MKKDKSNNFYSSDLRKIISKIKKIISIPRSNSTIIELILGSSSSIGKVIHEPFHEFGYYDTDPNISFQEIIKAVKNYTKGGDFLLKDMSQWLVKKDVYKSLLLKSCSPVILLIKNPFLSIESKIVKILEGVDRKERPDLVLQILKEFNIDDNKMYKTRDALNLFAMKNGYSNWKTFLKKEALVSRNYSSFEIIINFFSKGYKNDIWGWKRMNTLKRYLEVSKIKYKILDGLDFQILPEATISALCKLLYINLDKSMFTFSPKKFKKILNINKLQPDGLFWYKEAFSNSEIYIPKNNPINITSFPKCVKKYIKKIALPIYKKLSSDSEKINVLEYSDNFQKDLKRIRSYALTDTVYSDINNKLIKIYVK